jgi:hypothetical protein
MGIGVEFQGGIDVGQPFLEFSEVEMEGPEVGQGLVAESEPLSARAHHFDRRIVLVELVEGYGQVVVVLGPVVGLGGDPDQGIFDAPLVPSLGPLADGKPSRSTRMVSLSQRQAKVQAARPQMVGTMV